MKTLLIQNPVFCFIWWILFNERQAQEVEDTSYVMRIGSQYVQGLQFDHSLCRVFQPTLEKSSVTFDRGGAFTALTSSRIGKQHYITRMRPLITKSPHYQGGLSPVRFIILNRCNPLDRRSTGELEIWSRTSGAIECQSRDFIKVCFSDITIFY